MSTEPAMPQSTVAATLLAGQQRAFLAEGPPDLALRLDRLDRLEKALRGAMPALGHAVSADFGHRPMPELILAETGPVLSMLAFARRYLSRWMRPQRRRVGLGFRPGQAWVEWQPLGCVGIVSPWNYPLLLSVAPMIDALAAGNRVLLKPSEFVPRFSDCLADALTAFGPEELAVVQGGPDVAKAFCALPFDHLVFTGSTERGRDVARAAAESLTPVTLELGGKSPVLLCPDYDPVRAARQVAVGKFFNAGQTCLAPDYALVPAEAAELFARSVLARARRFFPEPGNHPDYASIISDRHLQRLQNALTEAEARGARVLRHGGVEAGRRMGPAVVLDPPDDCTLMREEIFGPILPVRSFRSLDEAIGFINQRPRPLALYPFTHDNARLRRILAGTRSGGVTCNGTILHAAQPDLPFGGVGWSGNGVYHGEDGFRRLSHPRAIYRPGWFNGFTMLTPPHGWRMRLVLRAILR